MVFQKHYITLSLYFLIVWCLSTPILANPLAQENTAEFDQKYQNLDTRVVEIQTKFNGLLKHLFGGVHPSQMLSMSEMQHLGYLCFSTFSEEGDICSVFPVNFFDRHQAIKNATNCFREAQKDIKENGATERTASECISYVEPLMDGLTSKKEILKQTEIIQ